MTEFTKIEKLNLFGDRINYKNFFFERLEILHKPFVEGRKKWIDDLWLWRLRNIQNEGICKIFKREEEQ